MKLLKPTVKLSDQEKLLTGRELTPAMIKSLSNIKITANDRRKK